MILKVIIGFFLSSLINTSLADEIRPGYLALNEKADSQYSVLWKVPAKGSKKLRLAVRLPDNCTESNQMSTQLIDAAYIQRWTTVCDGGLRNRSISVTGLESTNTDVILHLEMLDGISFTGHLTPTETVYVVPEKASSFEVIRTYTWLGIEHILFGIDHLLFVFALLLIVNNTRRLIITITAFTLAHSITLAGATLGFLHVPQQPVEAVIALSILFLAMEIIHGRNGRPGLAARQPWLIAFIFGLLHGFGFAGALADVGLPQHAIPLALTFFNVGVELGQVFFVISVVTVTWLIHRFKQPAILEKAETLVVYSIGSLSSFWLFERVSQF